MTSGCASRRSGWHRRALIVVIAFFFFVLVQVALKKGRFNLSEALKMH